ncbi:hypothetical protein D3C75_1021940 [compost metagenome]
MPFRYAVVGNGRAMLVCMTAQGDDIIGPVQNFRVNDIGGVAADVNANLVHNFNGAGVQAMSLQSGTFYVILFTPQSLQKTVCNLASAGIAGTEKIHKWFIHLKSSFSIGFNVRQSL